MGIKIKKYIMDVPEYIPGRTIDEIKEKYNLKKVYKLASNESLFGPDYGVLKEIRKNLRNIKYYPDGSCIEIRKKISEKFSIDINSVIIGNGTDQIIEMICDSFIGEGDNIVISDPTFLIYEKSTLKCNGIVVKVRLKKLSQDVEELVKSINDKTKILFITNPHNPTGSKLGFSEFDYIMENVNQDVLVVMDEAYRDYMAEEDKIDTVSYVSRHNNLIILRTFSKIYGLAGLRIGYGISDNKVISALKRTNDIGNRIFYIEGMWLFNHSALASLPYLESHAVNYAKATALLKPWDIMGNYRMNELLNYPREYLIKQEVVADHRDTEGTEVVGANMTKVMF